MKDMIYIPSINKSCGILYKASSYDLYESKIYDNMMYIPSYILFSTGTDYKIDKIVANKIEIAYSYHVNNEIFRINDKVVLHKHISDKEYEIKEYIIQDVYIKATSAIVIALNEYVTFNATNMFVKLPEEQLNMPYASITTGSPRVNRYDIIVYPPALPKVNILSLVQGTDKIIEDTDIVSEWVRVLDTPRNICGVIEGNNVIHIYWDGETYNNTSTIQSVGVKNDLDGIVYEVMMNFTYQPLNKGQVDTNSSSSTSIIKKSLISSIQFEIPINFGYSYCYVCVRKVNLTHTGKWSKTIMIQLNETISKGAEPITELIVDVLIENCKVTTHSGAITEIVSR